MTSFSNLRKVSQDLGIKEVQATIMDDGNVIMSRKEWAEVRHTLYTHVLNERDARTEFAQIILREDIQNPGLLKENSIVEFAVPPTIPEKGYIETPQPARSLRVKVTRDTRMVLVRGYKDSAASMMERALRALLEVKANRNACRSGRKIYDMEQKAWDLVDFALKMVDADTVMQRQDK